MKTLILAAIRCSLMFLVTTAPFRPAQAYTITLKQAGSNVVANGSGPIDLTGLTFRGSGTLEPGVIVPNFAIIQIGTGVIDQYRGITGPTSFGSGLSFLANTNSGDSVGIFGSNVEINVPEGYVSGTALSDSMTFNNATFASLGVTPGTYVWTWGTGLPNQNFTLIIGGAGVPDGGSTVSLLGCALLGLGALRRKLGC
jgi:hypothetical protein